MNKTTEIKHGEYTAAQASNNHLYIYKDGRLVLHAQFSKKMSEEELREKIDFYIEAEKRLRTSGGI